MVVVRPVSALEISGFYKSFFVADKLPEAVHQQMGIEEPWVGAVSQRLRLDGYHGFNDWLSLSLAYNLVARAQDPVLFTTLPVAGYVNAAGYRVADLDPLLFPHSWDDVGSFAVFQNLDRLFFTAEAPWFDVYVGRQAVAWGSARAVNPTDVIAPFLYTDLDTENRIGVDAARVRAPLGALGEVDAGYIAGEDFEFDQSAFFLRARTYAAKSDLAGLVVGFREHLMIGADITRAIGGAGSWFEIAYVFANALGSDREGGDLDYLRLSTGADYSFGRLYGYLEYHFNQAGASNASSYNDVLSTPAYTDGAVYLFGQHYIMPGASFQLTPLTSILGSALVNMNDPSVLLVAVLDYNFREDVYLEFGAYLGVGDSPILTNVGPTSMDSQGTLGFNSEFGAYPDMYYTSFRIYF